MAEKYTVVNDREILYNGVVIARCLTGANMDIEVTMEDAAKNAKMITDALNNTKQTSKRKSSRSSK